MSDTTEDMEHGLAKIEAFNEEYSKTLLKEYDDGTLHWTSQTGDNYPVKDMPVGYIVNVIKFLKRHTDTYNIPRQTWIEILETEFKKRIA